MPQLSVLVASPDRRVVTPAELREDPYLKRGKLEHEDAEELSEAVSDELLRLYRGREPWRQTYAEQLLDASGSWLRPSRWPIESTPVVHLGGTALTPGLYQVSGRCRHVLYRNPDAESLLTTNVMRAPLVTGETSDFRLPTYIAGYVPPGSINAAWEASTAYVVGASTSYTPSGKGSWVQSSNRQGQLLFECTTSGTSGATEPSFPLSLAEWAPEWVYESTEWVDPLGSDLIMEPTTPGTSGDTEPAWPETAGETVADGTVIWTARESMEIVDGSVTWSGYNAQPFPRPIRKAAMLLARIIRSFDLDGKCDEYSEKMMRVKSMLTEAC